MTGPDAPSARPPRIRWGAGLAILVLGTAVVLGLRGRDEVAFQQRNIQTWIACFVTLLLLAVWWFGFSRASARSRWLTVLAILVLGGLFTATVRMRGVSGDLAPNLEFRWAQRPAPAHPDAAPPAPGPAPVAAPAARPDYPQFLGPDRNAVLSGPALEADWVAHPPQRIWKRSVGAAWSGFVIVGSRALTQEQRGGRECVTCYDVVTGRELWAHEDEARYETTIAGEGPRCTPTVVGDRVYALGATGILNCLDLATGRRLWSRNLAVDAGVGVPAWGFSGSPLLLDGRVIVSAGGGNGRSLLAYAATDGAPVWQAGSAPANYGSPVVMTLAGVRQILAFNSQRITAHAAASGRVLWEHPWGVGQPHVSIPVQAGTNRVLFSSGYGVGSELLEIRRADGDAFEATALWKSRKMKAKFANLVRRDGFIYGLDDGMLACLDLADGSQRWKEGRYGHGQGLLVGDLFVLMAEAGEVVLLRPTPEAPNELARLPVFESKTWNPIALAGDLLLVRNDREAALFRLPLAATGRADAPPAAGR